MQVEVRYWLKWGALPRRSNYASLRSCLSRRHSVAVSRYGHVIVSGFMLRR
jgi:hypothetical protein